MNHATKCKFCGREMVVQIADDYPSADPFKLLRLAACNRCADLRVKKRVLEESLCRTCNTVQFASQSNKNAAIEKARPLLDTLTRKYASLVADWHNMSGYLWDEEFVNLLTEKPDRVWTILGHYWKTFRATQKIR